MNTKSILTLLLFALTGLAVGPSVAETACKGLGQPACEGSQQCSWVKGYTRKDGREVAPYCRVKPAGKSAAADRRATTPRS